MIFQRLLRLVVVLCVVVVWFVVAATARADDWPNYRGPQHNGISQETDWQADWDAKEPNILWKKSIGIGFSSIAVADGRAYMMGNTGDEDDSDNPNVDIVFCVDAVSGKELWRHDYPCPLHAKYYNGGTLSTPTVDGRVVYTLSKVGDLFCLDAASGEVVWKRQLNEELGFELPTWRIAGSPVVWGDLLVLNIGTAGAALNKKTGEVVWQNGKEICGYATPVPYEMNGQSCFALFAKQSVIGITAKEGKRLWDFEWKTKYDVNAADPIVTGNRVFISSGYKHGCALIEIDGDKATEVWQSDVMRTQMNGVVLYKGHLYGFDEAKLKCITLDDGTEKWSEGSLGKGALMMTTDGRMILMSERSELVIAKADPTEYVELARTQLLPRGRCWTTPVLANGRIYARNAAGDAACVDVSGK